jgi:alanine racemase
MPLSWVEIDLAALRHNFSQARARLTPRTHIMGIVKSDAYGHGMVPVSRELAAYGVHFLGVSKFWEAQELRTQGLRLPILVLLGFEPDDMEEAIRQGIRPLIFRMDHARLLSRTACRLDMSAPFHLKLDTGMGRLGVPLEKAPSFLDELATLPGISLEGVTSHFAVADEADKAYSEFQLSRLSEVLGLLDARGYQVPYVHIANSAGILDLPGAHFQMVRPGIMLYGSSPSSELLHPADLRPVMHFKSRILQLKDVPCGQCIGYGRTYVANCACRIATIPVGYDDGYSRLLSNCGQVLIRGKRAPVVGRVSMNMITVDVTQIPETGEDDEVVLLGAQGSERITAEEIAGFCKTISYEVYCHIGRHRFKRFLNATEAVT